MHTQFNHWGFESIWKETFRTHEGVNNVNHRHIMALCGRENEFTGIKKEMSEDENLI